MCVSILFVQCYLFAYFSVWRNIKSFLAFALICLCNMYLYELRNVWQILFHVTVGAFITLQIRLRQLQGKAPDYNVWKDTWPAQRPVKRTQPPSPTSITAVSLTAKDFENKPRSLNDGGLWVFHCMFWTRNVLFQIFTAPELWSDCRRLYD